MTPDPNVEIERKPLLAYLCSQYPAPSHTFIAREIAALEQQGWQIDRFSIRSGGASGFDHEASRTYVLLQQSPLPFLGAHLFWLITHPVRYFGALRLALRHRAPGTKALFLVGAHFAEAAVLARELNRRGCNHLHNHFANSAATVGLIASRLTGIGWSFTMHGVSETDYPAGLLLGQKIESADWVACASWFMRAQGLRTVQPEQWQKLHVVRCGIDPTQLAFNPRKDPGGRSIVCVGRLSPEKAHAGLFEAFRAVLGSAPDAGLKLVGDGRSRDYLELLAAKLGIANRVQFLGSCSEQDTLAQIAASDLLVLPSLLEGLPVVLMEAMGLGIPVVAPRVAGIPELVEDGETGLLFTPSNWEELAARMLELLEKEAIRAKMTKKARSKVEKEFDVRGSARALSTLFKSQNSGNQLHKRVFTLSFGLREALILASIVISIAIAIAVTSSVSAPSSQPLPRSASAPK